MTIDTKAAALHLYSSSAQSVGSRLNLFQILISILFVSCCIVACCVAVEVLVLFDYDSQADDELTIRKGDVITEVIQQDGGWWEGVQGNRRGVFPDNFVRVSPYTFRQ